ncbi:M14/M99 family metallopeptidase [Pseudodesulfovibrio sp. zrk46]|uniref:M14/M99 family metallopeptidase n=1 Tax=Pseudodesulfovibrio sp. zrk46 TaxID=2725288 RepID=UPI001449BE11|nr:M14/M99 family metallopeptidase [Pseudodesulfovibrio sp. zrk46]QJB55285.1 succinylglutamate desuccinylase [Pseudodesulfovibrio sp. zrk46]
MRRFTILMASCLLLMAISSMAFAGSWEHSFFAGTQYPLKVVYLEGEHPGPTIMVQGGIQGDETSGFVTAQLLSRSKITRGNVIVLPRANVPSINLRKRQINVDMNRRFDQNYNRFYEDRVARVIRFLLAQSDAFIHLHEGSGFYNPTYVDSLRNPKRYGQSIIVDTLIYDKIDLAHTVNSVLDELNSSITSNDYQFKLFNTKTFDKGTDYPEMRKSLTCYALAEHGIPAMAVEVSKDIRQLDWKVRQQLAATIMLLNRFGVTVTPPEFTDADVRAYARKDVRVRVNGRLMTSDSVISLAPGATLDVKQEAAGLTEFAPELALFASDRPGVNLMKARRMALEPFSELELRSDGRRVARTRIKWTGKMPATPGDDKPVFVCWLNGNPTFVRDGEVLQTVLGDQLILEGLWGSDLQEVVNLKGFVAIPWANNGQDMGWEIILDPGNFMSKYGMKSDIPGAVRYRVVRETPGAPMATFYVDIAPRTVMALRLADKQGQSLLIPWTSGGTYRLPEGEYVLEAAWSNGPGDKLLATAGNLPVEIGTAFKVDYAKPVELTVRHATTFGDIGTMTFSAGGLAQRSVGHTN